MSADRHKRKTDLFTAAYDLPPDQREAFVRANCGGDLEMAAEVLAMLAQGTTKLECFMPAPFVDLNDPKVVFNVAGHDAFSADPARRREEAGTQIGPYTLRSILGHGGWGEVWLADQTEPIKRFVAIKIIRFGMDSDSVVARFKAERQALALMDHPGIAKVFDAGATNLGRPYFVMQYIKGEPITTYCDRAKLTIPQRLELFCQVCEAVQHAHTKGIIHRDLKPSNILVDISVDKQGTTTARPMVIDFGIAKALNEDIAERAFVTRAYTPIGTAEYMSPEQVGVKGSTISTSTDVYALGVLLYELVTGALPFDSQTLRGAPTSELQAFILNTDPPRPATRLTSMDDGGAAAAAARGESAHSLAKVLRGELAWIPLKAIRKTQAERYESPAQLASDIRNYLDNRPLIAGPESGWYRARKFATRNKGMVAAAAAIATSLVLGIAAFAWQARVAQRERDETKKAELRVIREKGIADKALRTIREVLTSVTPENSGGKDVTINQVVEKKIAELKTEPPADDAVSAHVLSTLAEVVYSQGNNPQQAKDLAKRALGAFKSSYPSDSLEVAVAEWNVFAINGDFDYLKGAEWDVARRLMQRGGMDSPDARDAATTAAWVLFWQRNSEATEFVDWLTRAVEVVKDPVGSYSRCVLKLIQAVAMPPGPSRSLALRSAVNYAETGLGIAHPVTLDIRARVADNLVQEDLPEAISLQRDTISKLKSLLGPINATVALESYRLGGMLKHAGVVDEAIETYREAIAICSKLGVPCEFMASLNSIDAIGQILISNGRQQEAVDHYETSIKATASCADSGSERCRYYFLWNLSTALTYLKRYPEAIANAEKAIEVGGRVFGPDSSEVSARRAQLESLQTK